MNSMPTAPLSFHRSQILANCSYLFPQHPISSLQVITTYSRHSDEHTGAHVVVIPSGKVLLSFTDSNKIAELRRGLNCTFVDPALYWLYIEVQCLVEEKMFHGVAVGEVEDDGMEKEEVKEERTDAVSRAEVLEEELQRVRGELQALKARRRTSSRRSGHSRRASEDLHSGGLSDGHGMSPSPRKVPRFTRSEHGRLVEEGGEFLLVEREKE